ncbi:hypothetical protein FVE85_0382 [Porphyridium purpureum]|uniref:Uncharacterized protein n=1 Tax=Porphyridium purpureum TaxID=35688 RepID=A0A5J4Z1A3_PORPP|nr:hypothetical protein FVE85_0382 [Porphyridium purpureum]|eukprot:POR2466..scf208_2
MDNGAAGMDANSEFEAGPSFVVEDSAAAPNAPSSSTRVEEAWTPWSVKASDGRRYTVEPAHGSDPTKSGGVLIPEGGFIETQFKKKPQARPCNPQVEELMVALVEDWPRIGTSLGGIFRCFREQRRLRQQGSDGSDNNPP